MNLLSVYPKTRINDRFVTGNSHLDFTIPLENVRDPIIKGEPNELSYRFAADFYKKIGLDIVAETAFEYPYPFVTEKTYRSISCLRPFIILGPYQTLNFIKSFGFKTFSAIINEDYDSIKDPVSRFDAVCNSIKAFVDRPISEIRHDVESISDILIYNNQVLSVLKDQEFNRFKLQTNNDPY